MPHSTLIKRGAFIASGATALFALTTGLGRSEAGSTYAVTHSNDDWKRILGADRYYILRENGTEPAFSSPLIKEARHGVYRCAGCDQALFSSDVKYDSGDGWPSFWTVLPRATLTRNDYTLVEQRTEVHCSRCGGHLGHIFDDGPPPTHLRYCIDGLALHFIPSA